MTTAIIERVEPTNIVEVTHPTYVIAAEGADAFATGVLQAREAARAAALSAATAESAAGPTYANTAAGLAATSDGEAFAVDNGDGTVTVWLNDGGVAVEQRTLATTDYLASAAGAGAIGVDDRAAATHYSTAQGLVDYLQSGNGSSEIGFQWAEPNAVLRNLYDKAKDPGVSVKDFGALGNGSADDTLSISQANSVATLLGVPLFFPSGTYLTSANSQITTTWRGYGAVIKFVDNLSPGLIATASVASVTAEGVTIEGMTFDGNRANQTWDWVGSANYGLAVQAGGVTVMNCVTRNVTGNGTGVPTKTGTGRVAFINHRSYNNGKKGLHSGTVSGVDIIGGEWFDNENDSGIGIHQGGSDFNITAVSCHNNGTYGIHCGHSNAGPSYQSHDIIITGASTSGNTIAGIIVASSQSPTHAERIFNVNIVGGIVRDKIVLQAATNVYITGTDLQGSNIEADNFSNLVIDGVKMLLPGTGVRIRCRRVGIGVDTEPTSNGLHIVNTVINTTGATSGITVSGTESGRIVNPMYVGAAPASYYLHVSNFTRDISIKTDYPVRLGSTNLTGVQDNGTQRIAYGAATPSSGDWLVSDRLILPTATVDVNGMIQVGRICIVAGSPGTWESQFISTVSPAT